MKTPNYENTVGKHPIPHAKGIAKDEDISKDEIENNDKQKDEKGKDEKGKKNKQINYSESFSKLKNYRSGNKSYSSFKLKFDKPEKILCLMCL